jgi:hypothetical protein
VGREDADNRSGETVKRGRGNDGPGGIVHRGPDRRWVKGSGRGGVPRLVVKIAAE